MTAIDNAFNEWFNEDIQDDIRSLIFRTFKAGFEDGMREGMLIVMNTEAGRTDAPAMEIPRCGQCGASTGERHVPPCSRAPYFFGGGSGVRA